MCKKEVRVPLTSIWWPITDAQVGDSRPGPSKTHHSDGKGRGDNKHHSHFWNLHSWRLFFIAERTWMRITKLEEHLYFLQDLKNGVLYGDYIQCGSGPPVFAGKQLLSTPSTGRKTSSEQSGWWAGWRPLLHWSPSRKPCPQLCLPPPPFWSAARLTLAGGMPNPDTPPLLLGSQRYLEQGGNRGREDNKVTSAGLSGHLAPAPFPGPPAVTLNCIRLWPMEGWVQCLTNLPSQHLAQCPDQRKHSLSGFVNLLSFRLNLHSKKFFFSD